MKPVLVKWKDSESWVGWRSQRDVDDWNKHSDALIKSVGYLYKKSKKYVIIVQSIHAYDVDTNLGEPLRIPRECVVSIEKLK